jgi:hypothetical protein
MLQALGAPPATAAAAAGPGLFDSTRRWHVFDNLGVKRWLSGSTLASSVRQGRCDEACQWLLQHAVSVHLCACSMPVNFTAAAHALIGWGLEHLHALQHSCIERFGSGAPEQGSLTVPAGLTRQEVQIRLEQHLDRVWARCLHGPPPSVPPEQAAAKAVLTMMEAAAARRRELLSPRAG